MKKSSALKAAAPATLASLLAAGGAKAEIVHITDSFDVGFDAIIGANWNIDQSDDPDANWSWNETFGILGINPFADGFSAYNGGFGNNLAAMTTLQLVSNTINFSEAIGGILSSGFIANATGFTDGVSGFMGFQFDPSGSQPLFGWASITLIEGGLGFAGLTVNEWAYDSTGAAIQVGAIPEPATTAIGLGALALGVAGLRRMRRARQANRSC